MPETAEPELNLELFKIETEKEIRLLEIKASVKKVVYGTMIVGVAAAFFPFAQQTAIEVVRYVSAEKSAQRSQREFDISFLESVSGEGRSPNLDDRIVLAEYYAHLMNEAENRNRWETFLQYLTDQRTAQRNAEVTAATLKAAPNKNSAEVIAIAETVADQLRRSSETAINSTTEPVVSLSSFFRQLDDANASVRRKARSALASVWG